MSDYLIDNGVLVKYSGNSEHIVIPEKITTIGSHAFAYCRTIQTVTIAETVTSIGEFAFLGCTSLKTVHIPNSVTEIGRAAFADCYLLQSVSIPNRLTVINAATFSRCRSLCAFNFPNNLSAIEVAAFEGCKSLESVDIPDSVISIEWEAFSGCSMLKCVKLPSNLASVEFASFYGCNSLETINIPSGVESISTSAFEGCKALKTVTIPSTVAMIDDNAFKACSSVEIVSIPPSVKRISNSAFAECDSLKKVIILGNDIEIERNTFGRNDDLHIYIDDFSALPNNYKTHAILGFAERNGEYLEPFRNEYLKYIKRNISKLISTAIAHRNLFKLICHEGLITKNNVPMYLEAAEKTGDPDLIALMVDYASSGEKGRKKHYYERINNVDKRKKMRQNKTGIQGLNFVIVGRLEYFGSHINLERIITSLGGNVMRVISSSVDYLIMDDTGIYTVKHRKAMELGIEIISEKEFLKMAGMESYRTESDINL